MKGPNMKRFNELMEKTLDGNVTMGEMIELSGMGLHPDATGYGPAYQGGGEKGFPGFACYARTGSDKEDFLAGFETLVETYEIETRELNTMDVLLTEAVNAVSKNGMDVYRSETGVVIVAKGLSALGLSEITRRIDEQKEEEEDEGDDGLVPDDQEVEDHEDE